MVEYFIKLIKSRQFYLGLLVLLISAAMILKLFNLQIVNGKVLDFYASRGSYSIRTIEAPRGNIYDRNGKLIAYNRTGYNVMVIRNNDVEDRSAMYNSLLQIFEKNGDTIDNMLSKYLTEDIEFTDLVDEEQKKNWLTKLINNIYQMDATEEEISDLVTSRQVFDYIRKEIMDIDKEYTDKEAYGIMSIMYTIVWNGNISTTNPQKIATDVSLETMMEIESRHLEFPGVYTEEIYFRQYNDPQMVSHLLGYVRAMSEEEYTNLYNNRKVIGDGTTGNRVEVVMSGRKINSVVDQDGNWSVDVPEDITLEDGDVIKINEIKADGQTVMSEERVFKTYSANDIVGKDGIEQAAERELKGEKGSKIIYVDKNGREIEEVYKKEAKSGEDVYLTIDLDLQRVARNSLIRNIEMVKAAKDYIEGGTEEENKDAKNFGDCIGGAVVAMDIKTGELLASVSYPDYDPSIFLASSSDELAQQAIIALYPNEEDSEEEAKKKSDESRIFNRVTKGLYAPGSVFKPIVSLAALQETATTNITADTTFNCQRTWSYKSTNLTCLAYHNHLSMIPAIAKSCNVFFYEAGVITGIETIDRYAELFGLATETGIEMPELEGRRSNPETMKEKEIDLQHEWTNADTAQTSIGQLYCQFTPVQIARYTAGLGAKGVMPDAHVIQKTVSWSGNVNNTQAVFTNIENISDENYEVVKEGMIGVVNNSDSSIKKYFDKFTATGITVAGKTGTPETGLEKLKQSSNGVCVCYAPADDPQIAVAVVLEHGVWGSNAAPIISDVMAQYFGLDEGEEVSYTVESTIPSLQP